MVIQIVQAMLCSPTCLLRLETASLWQNVGIALSAGIIEVDVTVNIAAQKTQYSAKYSDTLLYS